MKSNKSQYINFFFILKFEQRTQPLCWPTYQHAHYPDRRHDLEPISMSNHVALKVYLIFATNLHFLPGVYQQFANHVLSNWPTIRSFLFVHIVNRYANIPGRNASIGLELR